MGWLNPSLLFWIFPYLYPLSRVYSHSQGLIESTLLILSLRGHFSAFPNEAFSQPSERSALA